MNKLIGGVEGLPWARPWSHLWRPSVCPKPAVSLLNQHVSLEIYSRTESTHAHTNTRPRSDTLAHTNIKEDILLGVAKHTYTRIYTEACQDAKAQIKQILAQTHKRKQKFILFTRPRARANTWLARRFTPVWKDKHQPINKSVSLETCWPPSLSFCHTRNSRGQGQAGMSGGLEGGESVLVRACVHSFISLHAHTHRVEAPLCGWGLAASMFWQSGRELWPHQTLKDEVVSSDGTVVTNWHNLPPPSCQSLFKQTRIISVAQGGCVWVVFCYC